MPTYFTWGYWVVYEEEPDNAPGEAQEIGPAGEEEPPSEGP